MDEACNKLVERFNTIYSMILFPQDHLKPLKSASFLYKVILNTGRSTRFSLCKINEDLTNCKGCGKGGSPIRVEDELVWASMC